MIAQRQFDLRIPTARPLFSISGVMGTIDRSEDDVIMLIDEGLLPWAFDIRRARASRAEWRIWRESLVTYASADYKQIIEAAKMDPTAVIARILPGSNGPMIRRTSLVRAFNCSFTHITHLIADGLLQPAPQIRPEAKRPWNLELTRASVADFLRNRCAQSRKEP